MLFLKTQMKSRREHVLVTFTAEQDLDTGVAKSVIKIPEFRVKSDWINTVLFQTQN